MGFSRESLILRNPAVHLVFDISRLSNPPICDAFALTTILKHDKKGIVSMSRRSSVVEQVIRNGTMAFKDFGKLAKKLKVSVTVI